MTLLIKGGTIATSTETYVGDIYINNGVIEKIAPSLEMNVDKVIDAKGMYVVPGGIDVHTHFNLDVGIAVTADDFYTGSVAAAFGGTTTVVDHMGFGPKGCNLHHQLNKYLDDAGQNSVIDFGLHGVIQHVDDEIINEMESMVEDGICSFKGYMTYDYKLSKGDMERVMSRLKELNSITTAHCEDHEMIDSLKKKYASEGRLEPIYHAKSRPAECEARSIKDLIEISDKAGGAPFYVVHLSTGDGLDLIREAQSKGKPIYAETCPQYLFLNEDRYLEEDNNGLKYVMSPPLRERKHSEMLWKGIKDGTIQVVGTDHCSFNLTLKKKLGDKDFRSCPNGGPGVETRIPLMFSEGVMKERISINKFVDITSTNPAKLFGMYPQKGSLEIGSDADITIINPNLKRVINQKDLHENLDYTPYEGMEVTGWPVVTISNGMVLVEGNNFNGERGQGRFIKRSKSN